MTDSQIVAIAITVLAILGGTLINNTRIGDINNRIGDVKEVLRAELKAHRAEIDARLDKMEAKIDRIGETLAQMLSDHEQRIRALEQQRPR